MMANTGDFKDDHLRQIMQKQLAWNRTLLSYASSCRRKRPLPPRSRLNRLQKQQCDVITKEVKETFDVEQDRAAVSANGMAGLALFTSTIPGLVALQSVFPVLPEGYTFLLESEHSPFYHKYPRDPYEIPMTHCWSYFRSLRRGKGDKHFLDAAKEHFEPLSLGSRYLVQETGRMVGPLCGSGSEALWIWDGIALIPIEGYRTMWIS
jgi:hypothetical protein